MLLHRKRDRGSTRYAPRKDQVETGRSLKKHATATKNVMKWLLIRRLTVATLLAVVTATVMQQSDAGEVSFANSGAQAAQTAFLHGLAQLHNFEYEDASKDFRNAQAIDPKFAQAIALA